MSEKLKYELNIRKQDVLDDFAINMKLVKGKSKSKTNIVTLILNCNIEEPILIKKIQDYPTSDALISRFNKKLKNLPKSKKSKFIRKPGRRLLRVHS